MARALALAERGRGRTSPNPMVGAVVVDSEGVVVGRGWHEVAGGPHAEVRALADAGDRSKGATLYCTLEPCTHVGRTDPCAPRVASAGITRAVIAVEDANPRVAGRGVAYLREHGIAVSVGVLGERARRLNAPFFTWICDKRPFVTLKIAETLDGYVSTRRGRRTSLTGAAANRAVHRERAEVDAIAVGSGTILVDDPLLTPRGAFRHRPLTRVVFDRRLAIHPTARIFSTIDAGPVIIFSTPAAATASQARAEELIRKGAHLDLIDPGGSSSAFLGRALERLAALDCVSLVVEGGPTLQAAFWEGNFVDRLELFLTPHIAGPGGVPGPPLPIGTVAALDANSVQLLGEDVLIEGHVHRTR